MSHDKKGISAVQLSKEVGVRYNRRSMEQDLMTRLLRATLATSTITYK